jgi:hypothetical protein
MLTLSWESQEKVAEGCFLKNNDDTRLRILFDFHKR